MRTKLILLPALVILVFLFAFRLAEKSAAPSAAKAFREYKKKNVARCTPDWTAISSWIDELDIPPMPGAGKHHWAIDTKNDSAQFYFDQGINMYYGFHIIEAMASFKKAARFDPSSAMLQWAQALAYGPNINDLGYAASPEALAASKKAIELSGNLATREKTLIEAQAARYSEDSTKSRESLNKLYTDKMKAAYQKFVNDADVAALYADAMMLQHPWDLWKPNGDAKPWTPLIRQVLEKLLVQHPQHPGANHYYIHVMEPSPYPEKALASADRLGVLTPGLSHLVHMPSHIYLRVGQYEKGSDVNEKAVASFKKYSELFAPVTGADFLYVIHNLHMQVNNGMMEGRKAYSIKSAQETVNSIGKDYFTYPAPFGNLIQYIYMTPVFVHLRFGNWSELLALSKPPQEQVYSNIIYHFGRGMAWAQQGKLREARPELDHLRRLMPDSSLAIPMSPFSAALEGARVAENLLAGSIALGDKKFEDAITAFERAVEIEEKMVYNEPRDWLLNPRHYLGNAYTKAGQWDKARRAFLADLKMNDENGWALFGLYQVAMNAGRKSEAQKLMDRYNKAFVNADIELHAAVF